MLEKRKKREYSEVSMAGYSCMKKLVLFLFVICAVLASCTTPSTPDISLPDPIASASSDTTYTNTPIPSTSGVGYFLNVTAEEGGTVPAELSGTYPAYTNVELVAYPNSGFSFYRWVDHVSDTHSSHNMRRNPINYMMQEYDASIVATFKETSELFHLDIIDGPHGGIPAGGATLYRGNYLEGEIIVGLITRSFPGWVFERWIVLSLDYGITGTIEHGVSTFTMPPYDVILVAEYSEREVTP